MSQKTVTLPLEEYLQLKDVFDNKTKDAILIGTYTSNDGNQLIERMVHLSSAKKAVIEEVKGLVEEQLKENEKLRQQIAAFGKKIVELQNSKPSKEKKSWF